MDLKQINTTNVVDMKLSSAPCDKMKYKLEHLMETRMVEERHRKGGRYKGKIINGPEKLLDQMGV